MEISFKTKDHPESVTVNWDLPVQNEGESGDEYLARLVARFGADSVASQAAASYVIGAQAFGRRHIDKSQAEIQALFDSYDPNTRSAIVKQTPVERAKKAVAAMSAEERAELLALLGA